MARIRTPPVGIQWRAQPAFLTGFLLRRRIRACLLRFRNQESEIRN